MNKLKNWISNRLPIIQGIILILFFIISLIAGLNEWQNALMISLLLFIGCEFFLLIIGYLEQIMQYIRNVEKTQLTTSEDVDIKHYIKSAKYDIFISGSSLSCLSSVYRTLKELNPIIKLELCNLDKLVICDFLKAVKQRVIFVLCAALVYNIALVKYILQCFLGYFLTVVIKTVLCAG